MNFDSIEKRLIRRYAQRQEKNITYFFKEGKVVATKENNCIVMYFRCEPCSHEVIWNHYGIVAVAVVKNFQLIKWGKMTLADVVVVSGLCGACNTIQKVSNRLLEVDNNYRLKFQEESDTTRFTIGTIGYTKQRGIFEFDDLKIKLEVREDMCQFDSDALYYSILKTKQNRKRKNNPKHISEKDYDVFKMLKEKNDWHWNSGFDCAGSQSVRKMIERTKTANYHKLAKATLTILQN